MPHGCLKTKIDEQLIMRQTGHRSDAVRQYKRPNVLHNLQISSVLQPPSPKKPNLKNHEESSNSVNIQAPIVSVQENCNPTFSGNLSPIKRKIMVNIKLKKLFLLPLISTYNSFTNAMYNLFAS